MKQIPIHKLQDRASIGLEVGHTAIRGKKEELEAFDVHGDDNYIFLLIEKGSGVMTVYFQDVELNEWDLYFVAPGQVHYGIRSNPNDSFYPQLTYALLNPFLCVAARAYQAPVGI